MHVQRTTISLPQAHLLIQNVITGHHGSSHARHLCGTGQLLIQKASQGVKVLVLVWEERDSLDFGPIHIKGSMNTGDKVDGCAVLFHTV